MKYTHLGRTGLTVSRICLGTLNFGASTDEANAHAIMDQAHEHGLNFFDTANSYGAHRGAGESESVMGRWFARGGGRRDRTVLSTKIFGKWSEWPNHGGLSALAIRKAADAALSRLQTDYIDLLQMHHLDRSTPWDEIWQAMDTLRQQGKVIYVGASNFAAWNIGEAHQAARDRHLFGLASEQDIYNLLTRDIEREVIPALQSHGLGLLAWSPLHRGMLAGVLREQPDATRYRPESLAAHHHQLEQYEALCDKLGERPADVAIAWLLTRPAVTCPIVGPQNAGHLDGALHALDIVLDEETLASLDKIFPGYIPAPDDYYKRQV